MELAGMEMIGRLVLDANRAGDVDLFRLKEHPGDVIVSRRLKEALEKAGVTGMGYEGIEVSRRRGRA